MCMFIYVERERHTTVELRTAIVEAGEKSAFSAHKLVQSAMLFFRLTA